MNTPTDKYDIIFAGGGLAGLTLAQELAKRPYFREKTILLLDRDAKQRNDRTWCFWATEDEPLPPVLFKTWDRCMFYGENVAKSLKMGPYRYNMVRGIDFYNWADQQLAQYSNIKRVQTNIDGIDENAGVVHTSLGDFSAEWIFNSALTPTQLLPSASTLYPAPPLSVLQSNVPQSNSYTWLLQHFSGWIIETKDTAFDPQTATLMDFRIDQKGETRFMYVLPFSETEALVEFTVFSPALCPAEEYEAETRNYIHNFLKIKDFYIKEREFGVIPMTDFGFSPNAQGRTIHIGTAGGFVKGSSGYAFKRTQRRLRHFAAAWEKTGAPDPALLRSPYRFRMYDSIMLRVLRDRSLAGKILFSTLFRKLPASTVFRFLDEDTTFVQDLQLLNTPPAPPFIRAAFLQMPTLLRV
ncbi:MAG: lycopene cyclase family protein [Bacteroidota bacterium]